MKTKIVIFGATGDLVIKKIAPALVELFEEDKLTSETEVIGFARRSYAKDDYLNFLTVNLSTHDLNSKFKSQTSFISSEFDDDLGYLELSLKINADDNVIYYFSVAPDFYSHILTKISEHGLNFPSSKILVEKPIGKKLEEAKLIESVLSSCFQENQIYRIDHYLQKKMLKNIFAFRFYNSTFKSSWNNKFIESIHIYSHENFGVESRGDFYDSLGALRDVGQNHLLELLAVTTMDEPKTFSATDIRMSRAKLLSQLEEMTSDKIGKQTYRAQHEEYQNITGVEKDSVTETYFKIITKVNSPRWRNVPTIIEAGKLLNRTETKVIVKFRETNKKISDSFEIKNIENKIEFSFKPLEKIDIGFDLISESLDKGLVCTIEENIDKNQYVAEYKQVLLDAINGNPTWFVSKEEVFSSWKFIDPINKAWKQNLVTLNTYSRNSTESIENSMYLNNHFNQTTISRRIGLIGLGKMGMGIAKQLHEKGWEVIATNRTVERVAEFREFGGLGANTVDEMISQLRSTQRIIWLMVSSEAVDEVLFGENGLSSQLKSDDIIIDAGNSNYKDTIRRAEKLAETGIVLVDAGISGGPNGARNGACSMVGGDSSTFEILEPIFRDISLPGAYRHFAGTGAGHFVKMVHNGIEYGMMQAIAEGFSILKKSDFNLNLSAVSQIYNNGSVIESRLIDWLYHAYQIHTQDLDNISGEVKQLGEGKWTVDAAKELGIPVKVIEDALQFRFDSKGNPTYTGKILSALRNQFGGHGVGIRND